MSDLLGIPHDEPTPIDMSNPFKGFAIAALLSLPLWIIAVGLIVLRVKS